MQTIHFFVFLFSVLLMGGAILQLLHMDDKTAEFEALRKTVPAKRVRVACRVVHAIGIDALSIVTPIDWFEW